MGFRSFALWLSRVQLFDEEFFTPEFLLLFASVVILLCFCWKVVFPKNDKLRSINFHFLRRCNYKCQYCFHRDGPPTKLSKEDIFRGLCMLKEAGCVKINFSGGEPFMQHRLLGEMVDFCKQELKMVTGVITNSSRTTKEWMERHGRNLDWFGVSIDSFCESTLREVGRVEGNKVLTIDHFLNIKRMCEETGTRFKVNTVVSNLNVAENMVREIRELAPLRWKVFQVLKIRGENSDVASRNSKLLVSNKRSCNPCKVKNEQFQQFIDRHKSAGCNPIAENNQTMRNSYVILDENLCFLNNGEKGKTPSQSILNVGVHAAFNEVVFDETAFVNRKGDVPLDIEDFGGKRRI